MHVPDRYPTDLREKNKEYKKAYEKNKMSRGKGTRI